MNKLTPAEKSRALFERSEFARRRSWRTAQGTRRATPRPTWFLVLLPKQKDLGYRAETRHLHFFAPNKAEVYWNDYTRWSTE